MTARLRLLLVDDEVEILELLTMAFHDFDVETAVNAASATELLRTKSFDALITDVRMPGGSGLKLIDQATALHPGIAVFVMTGHHQEPAEDTRVARWLFKPFSVTALRTTVLEVLAGRQPNGRM
jgi:two-component system, NtrC family, response regulator GlrR